MFAQRGHSYWREEQLLEPMRALLKSGEIKREKIPDINRFLSIGSCGGIRIYSELNRLFDNTIDIFATVGTGKAVVNDPYNQRLFEMRFLGWCNQGKNGAWLMKFHHFLMVLYPSWCSQSRGILL